MRAEATRFKPSLPSPQFCTKTKPTVWPIKGLLW